MHSLVLTARAETKEEKREEKVRSVVAIAKKSRLESLEGNAARARSRGAARVAIASLDRFRNRRAARGARPHARIDRRSRLNPDVAHRAHVSPVASVHPLDVPARPRRGCRAKKIALAILEMP